MTTHDHCDLVFPTIGKRRGSSLDSQFFLIQVLELMVKVKAQPAGSTLKAFDVSNYDIRFKMEPVPQHPLDKEMAYAAMGIIYSIVNKSEIREFVALVTCWGMALGRFRAWLMDTQGRDGALS